MILRSVTKHVKDQNWFAVFVDLVIVVIGVFIGIQVANWNEELAGERQASVLLNRLYVDLIHDKESIENELKYQAAVNNYAMTAVAALNGEETISDEQLVIGAYQATQINGIWNNRATYEEMLSTGQFNLIESEHLKVLAFAYYSTDMANNYLISTVAPYREFMRSLIPIALQNTIIDSCGDMTVEVAGTYAARLPETCDIDGSDELIQETADKLRSHSETLLKLNYQIAVHNTQVFNLNHFLNENRKFMNALKEHQQ